MHIRKDVRIRQHLHTTSNVQEGEMCASVCTSWRLQHLNDLVNISRSDNGTDQKYHGVREKLRAWCMILDTWY